MIKVGIQFSLVVFFLLMRQKKFTSPLAETYTVWCKSHFHRFLAKWRKTSKYVIGQKMRFNRFKNLLTYRTIQVGFLCRFGLKTGIDFAHFGLESVMALKGTKGVYQCI